MGAIAKVDTTKGLIQTFKGACRGKTYTYMLYRQNGELVLESRYKGVKVADVTWIDNEVNNIVVEKACEEIRERK